MLILSLESFCSFAPRLFCITYCIDTLEIQKAIEPELNTRTQTQAQYDVLEAMAYIEKGFLDSGLTAWFDGPMPRTYPGEVQSGHRTMSEAVNEARRALDDARNGINENEGPPAASVCDDIPCTIGWLKRTL